MRGGCPFPHTSTPRLLPTFTQLPPLTAALYNMSAKSTSVASGAETATHPSATFTPASSTHRCIVENERKVHLGSLWGSVAILLLGTLNLRVKAPCQIQYLDPDLQRPSPPPDLGPFPRQSAIVIAQLGGQQAPPTHTPGAGHGPPHTHTFGFFHVDHPTSMRSLVGMISASTGTLIIATSIRPWSSPCLVKEA